MNFQQEYQELRQALIDLPDQANKLNMEVTELSIESGKLSKSLDARCNEVVFSFSGGDMKKLGSNAEIRKKTECRLCQQDETYRRISEALENTETELKLARTDLENVKRTYGAVCFQAQLSAAYMAHIGQAISMNGHADNTLVEAGL